MARLSRRTALLGGLMTCLFMTWAGFSIWDYLTRYDAVWLILHGSVDERRRAARDLSAVNTSTDIDEVMAALIRASDDEDAEVRASAAECLGKTVSSKSSSPYPSGAEVKMSEQRVDIAGRTLLKSLSDKNPLVRASAARSYGAIGTKSSVSLPADLIAALLRDKSISVRQATMKALHEVRLTPDAVARLVEALQSADREIRFNAAEILGRLGADATSAIPTLLATLKEPFDVEEQKKNRVGAWYGDPACAAAKAVAQIAASEEVIVGLTEMLSSEIAERVSSAAEGLGNMGPRAAGAVPRLIAAYEKVQKSDKHVIGQIRIPEALGMIAPNTASAPDAVLTLVNALDSGDKWVRLGGAKALGRFGADAAIAVPKLRQLGQDPVEYVRDAASASLAIIEQKPTESKTADPD
jgi:HEAT repeat protein